MAAPLASAPPERDEGGFHERFKAVYALPFDPRKLSTFGQISCLVLMWATMAQRGSLHAKIPHLLNWTWIAAAPCAMIDNYRRITRPQARLLHDEYRRWRATRQAALLSTERGHASGQGAPLA
jgi:hypothetical protein